MEKSVKEKTLSYRTVLETTRHLYSKGNNRIVQLQWKHKNGYPNDGNTCGMKQWQK